MEIREEWRPVRGYEGLYEVSNFGRVRSLDRFVKNRFSERKIKGHIFEGSIKKDGYLRVRLSGKDYLVHILVAQAFPEICCEWFEGCCVHHKNYNKTDNRPENLIVLTNKEHSKLHYQETLPETFTKPSEKRSKSISKALTGRRAYERHIPIIQLTKEGEVIKEWECISDVAKVGYSPGNVCMCCRGQVKTAYGFLWRYAVSN